MFVKPSSGIFFERPERHIRETLLEQMSRHGFKKKPSYALSLYTLERIKRYDFASKAFFTIIAPPPLRCGWLHYREKRFTVATRSARKY